MTDFSIKPGVDMNGIRPEMAPVMLAAMCAIGNHVVVVTSACQRKAASAKATGQADRKMV